MQITISRNGQQFGPYTEEQARAYVQQGQLQASDLAWTEGQSGWVPLSTLLQGIAPAPGSVPPPPPAAAPSGGGGGGMNDRTLAMLAHLLPIFTGFLAPLIIWLVKKDDPQAGFVVTEAKEALNFQITVFIAVMISWVLMFVLIGLLLMPLVVIANIVFCILAAVKVNGGVSYRYPFALRLVN